MQDATLVFLLKGEPVSEVLLGYKKVGFGQGKYAGYGGKVERGEGVAEAALRELTEEARVQVPDPESLTFRAVLEFHFPYQPTWEQRVFVFITHNWDGKPVETNEMRPHWFAVEELPYPQMWSDARYWLPQILSGNRFEARFRFGVDNVSVADVEFFPLQPLP